MNAPPPFTPSSAVEAQDELVRFYQTRAGQSFMQGIVEARMRDGYSCVTRVPEQRAAHELRTVAGARTYFVTSDMVEVAEHAAKQMPSEPLMQTDLPCPVGFVVFERAVMIPDVHGKMLAMCGFAWRQAFIESEETDGKRHTDSGIVMTYYGDSLDQRDDYVRDEGPWTYPTRMLYIGEDGEVFGEDDGVSVDAVAERLSVDVGIVTVARFYMRSVPRALWALVQSEGVADSSSERADRATRRRLERARSPLTGEVVVVRLRRHHHDASEGGARGAVEWSRRWIVSGHWRRAWRPSVKAHRLTWIAPFVKGPEGKPLVIPRRVHVLER